MMNLFEIQKISVISDHKAHLEAFQILRNMVLFLIVQQC